MFWYTIYEVDINNAEIIREENTRQIWKSNSTANMKQLYFKKYIYEQNIVNTE